MSDTKLTQALQEVAPNPIQPVTVVAQTPPNTVIGIASEQIKSVSLMSADQLTRVLLFILMMAVLFGGGFFIWKSFEENREDKALQRSWIESELEKTRQWYGDEREKDRRHLTQRDKEHDKTIIAFTDVISKLTTAVNKNTEAIEYLRKYLKVPARPMGQPEGEEG